MSCEVTHNAGQKLIDDMKEARRVYDLNLRMQNPQTGVFKEARRAAAAEEMVKNRFTQMDQIAEQWAKDKSAGEKALSKLYSFGSAVKEAFTGAADITDLERRVGILDRILQTSRMRSIQAGREMKKAYPNISLREAAMIWIDAGGEEGVPAIKAALEKLPANTRKSVKIALQIAANMPEQGVLLAESIRQFYGIRGNDAVKNGVMEQLLENYVTHIWRDVKKMPDEIRGALSNGQLNEYFQFAKKRKLGTFLKGILAGYDPILDPADILPHYNYELDRAVASREFVRDASNSVFMDDGRPAFSPGGTRKTVGEGEGEIILLDPRGRGHVRVMGAPETPKEERERTEDMYDYKTIEHPAMRKWAWGAYDEDGKTVLYQADLMVHPQAHSRIAKMMDGNVLTPSKIVRGALTLSNEAKGFKLGTLSLFHPVHVGMHAVFHWTNPFKSMKNLDIYADDPKVKFAIEKGHLALAPKAGELNAFANGDSQLGLVYRIPFIGHYSRAMSEWTFGRFIPRLKYDTFNNAYDRALYMNKQFGTYRGLSNDQIAARIGDSVNNAFGELNHWFLGKDGRDPRFQRALRLAFIAPDFGEARLRFVGKTATKHGTEERLAMATMFVALYTAARVGNIIANGDPQWDLKRMFSVKVGNHWWSMRSVAGDMVHAYADFGRFMYVRLNPIYTRTFSDVLFGRDVNGQKLSNMQKFVIRPLEQFIPVSLQGMTDDYSKTWESFVSAAGVQTRRETPVNTIQNLVREYKSNSADPKVQADFAREQAEVLPPSDYKLLRYRLSVDDEKGAWEAYEQMLAKGHDPEIIKKQMEPGKPFTRSTKLEAKFKASLNSSDYQIYQEAVAQQRELYQKFLIMKSYNTTYRP